MHLICQKFFVCLCNACSEAISGIGLSDILDHLAVCAMKLASYRLNKPNKRVIRDMRNFNQNHFLNNLCQQFNENLTQDDGDSNAYFSNFRKVFSKTIDKHATRRPISRQE